MRRAIVAATLFLALSFALSGQQRLARSEYAEPQFERTQWVSLNGPWQFEFDDGNVGLEEGWATGPRTFSDVEQEVNGLLTDDRTPKFDLAAIRDINRLLK